MSGRIPILDVQPVLDCGSYRCHAVVGETFTVSATVFREGHDAVSATAVLISPDGRRRLGTPMVPRGLGTDRWDAEVTPDEEGDWIFAVEGWSDPWATWRHNAEIKVEAQIDVELVLLEAAQLLERSAKGLPRGAATERVSLRTNARAVRDQRLPQRVRYSAATAPDISAVLARYPLRDLVTSSAPYPLHVERERALYGAWYELFPRSEGAHQDAEGHWVSGTFRTAAERLPAVAAMGFEVLYLPPVHPIGQTFRKGANNTLNPGPDDPGVPWAIGAAEGGHDAIHPDLGTFEDFDYFVGHAQALGIEIALDLALQASPDHPWVKEHPEWFSVRADGTIAYAENPPKKYQDIYPVNFDKDPEGIYAEVLRIVRLWMDHGVRIFRVDNPHTKPVNFWHWLIGEIHQSDPDVIFLAEAFTKPAMMHTLGKIGFQQSYTYFTWRNVKWELEEYGRQLVEAAPYMRPNFFVNTQDILTAFLQYGGPAAFKIRAVLASMMSPTYGVYAGYELYEHVALRPGSEEYLDSEKYQYRPRDWAAYEPGGARAGQSLAPYLTRLNEIRRAHPALHWLRNLHFHHVDNAEVMAFSKRRRLQDGRYDTILVVVNLDPHGTRESMVHLDMPQLGLDWHETTTVHDLVTDESYTWGEHNYVRLDPSHEPAHIFELRGWHA